MSLHCKLVPVQYREYEYGLLQKWTIFLLDIPFYLILIYQISHPINFALKYLVSGFFFFLPK